MVTNKAFHFEVHGECRGYAAAVGPEKSENPLVRLKLTPMQAQAVGYRAEACDILAAAFDGSSIEATPAVADALTDAANAEDDDAERWRGKDAVLARYARQCRDTLTRVATKARERLKGTC